MKRILRIFIAYFFATADYNTLGYHHIKIVPDGSFSLLAKHS